MKIRTVNILGFDVDVYDFGYGQYMYPCFNGNAEFRVNSKGFRKLNSYLRTVVYFDNMTKSIFDFTSRQI